MATEQIFKSEPYTQSLEATVVDVNDRNGIILDRTIFYATGGGQPGDKGTLKRADGSEIDIATAVYDETRENIVHVPSSDQNLPSSGERVTLDLDWTHRSGNMRIHTCLHLLCSIVPFPVTGGQISPDSGRLDFDFEAGATMDKIELTNQLNELIDADHPVTDRWITDVELDANPELVRTMSVKPPRDGGKIRLVAIGEDGSVDLQPCGGTHVRSTAEIGKVLVAKIENKGKQNRRIRVKFA